MSWKSRIILLSLGSASLAGCSAADLARPEATPVLALSASRIASARAMPDLSGDWQWSNIEILAFPEFVAILVGIVPEGRLTHARCASAGTMVLQQVDEAVEGPATRTSSSCMTSGGQAFQQPGTVFNVADGRIIGNSIEFSFGSPMLPDCPHHAAISLQNGTATALRGTGRCILPGHPQSESPFPGSPGGLSKTIEWQAVRQ